MTFRYSLRNPTVNNTCIQVIPRFSTQGNVLKLSILPGECQPFELYLALLRKRKNLWASFRLSFRSFVRPCRVFQASFNSLLCFCRSSVASGWDSQRRSAVSPSVVTWTNRILIAAWWFSEPDKIAFAVLSLSLPFKSILQTPGS